MVVQQDQIRLQLQAELACRFWILRRKNVVPLILQDRSPIVAFHRSDVHKQDDWVHELFPLTHCFLSCLRWGLGNELRTPFTGLCLPPKWETSIGGMRWLGEVLLFFGSANTQEPVR